MPLNTSQDYPISRVVEGVQAPWGDDERAQWLSGQSHQRAYVDVEARIKALESIHRVESYGTLDYPQGSYALYAVQSADWDRSRPVALITGGVHGYETSGVLGALRFLERDMSAYAGLLNFVVLPCVSPWAYETINRWNPLAMDPNRAFVADSPAPEAAAVMQYLARLAIDPIAHFDLHETTDTDNSEFRPALAARDASAQDQWDIPDGFYAVADSSRPAEDFQRAIIHAVEQVTHIAPSIDGRIIGEKLQQRGVICYDGRGLGLCMGATNAPFVVTTEVYPDSPRVTAEECIEAQLAAIRGGLAFVLAARAA